MPKLVFIDRNFAGKSYPLIVEKTTVGRGDENVLVIRDSSLSSRHCEILVNGAEVIVRDLGSRNGTVVNGRLLKNQQTAVKHGQIIRFGLVDARLEIENMERNDDTGPESAVFDHRRVMRDQRRARNNPAPAGPSAKLEHLGSAEGSASEPKTILVPEPAPSAPAASSSQPLASEENDASQGGGRRWLWMALVAAGVLVVVWLIWGRK